MKINQLLISLSVVSLFANASVDDDVRILQNDWAIANYQTDDSKKEVVFQDLIKKAHEISERNHNSAEILTWEAIILSTYAGVSGGLSALGYVEEAISIITCTELLFEQFCREPLSVEVKQTERLPSIWSKVRHLISGMLSTFLQCFPVKDDSGNFRIVSIAPICFRLWFDSTRSTKDSYTAIEHLQRSIYLDCKINVPWSINYIEAMIFPKASSRGRLYSDTSFLLLLHEICSCSAVMHFSCFMNFSGKFQYSLGCSCLTRINVRKYTDISIQG